MRRIRRRSGAREECSRNGPVFITECGEDAFVLLTLNEYRRIGSDCEGITELLAESEAAELDFEPPSIDG